MPKYPNNHILMEFGEIMGFSTNFCPYIQYGDVEAMGQKIDQHHFSEFGVFPSKNHDSSVFMQFLLVTFRENHKKIENNDNQIFYFIFAFFSETIELSSVFNAEMNSTCQNTILTTFLWDLEKKGVFLPIIALTIVWRCGGYGPKN